MRTDPPELTIVVTCMGRLAHLRETLPRMLESTQANVVVVDWSCPEGTAQWVAQTFSTSQPERMLVVDRPGQSVFNKPAALNLGLSRAHERWGGWLCVLDADTLVSPAWWSWVVENVERGKFYFMEGYKPLQDLSGILLMHSEDYLASGGYDEQFVGWGAEDWDMRCRLYFKLGLPYVEIPCALASAIGHDDSLRTRYYPVKEKRRSHIDNQYRLIENVRKWTGHDLREMKTDEVRGLLGMRQGVE